VSLQSAYPIFCFEGQKVPYPASIFLEDKNLSWRNLITVNMVKSAVTRQSSFRATSMLGLFFLLM